MQSTVIYAKPLLHIKYIYHNALQLPICPVSTLDSKYNVPTINTFQQNNL